MKNGVDTIMVLLILTNLAALGTSRITMIIRMVALQGIVLSALPIIVDADGATLRHLLLAAGTIAMKGLVFPWLLLRCLRDAGVRREVDPYIGYTVSMLVGTAALAFSLWLDARLALPNEALSALHLPVSFFTIFTGLLLLLSRKQAISQVLGYVVLENGIYSFGMALAHREPFLVELGILLDIFVGVFIMGIAILSISREFEHMDTDLMTRMIEEEES